MSPVFLATKEMWKARLGSVFGWLGTVLTIFHICPHDWRDVKEVKVFETDRSTRPMYTKYVQRC